MKNSKKGFTLIELLVVIAIIGILSSVVLASLNTARSKGSDAAIKSNINNARAQAELYYDANNGSYFGVCAATSTQGGILTMKNGAVSAGGTCAFCVDNASGVGFSSAWAMSAQLKSNSSLVYCVDSTGVATTSALIAKVVSSVAGCNP